MSSKKPHLGSSLLLVLTLIGSSPPACEGPTPGTTPNSTSGSSAPTVAATTPANGAIDVPTSSSLTATFSEPVIPSTVNLSTFVLNPPVGGTVSLTGSTATFALAAPLTGSTTYTATLTTGIKDLTGTPMAAPRSWTFTTGTTPDTTRPTVSATTPTNGATNVAPSSALTATFSEPIDPLTASPTTFTLHNNTNNVALTGEITTNGETLTFSPATGFALSSGTTYTATLTTGIKDLAGNALQTNFSWTFTTGAAPDTTRPTVSATTPANGASNVSTSSSLTATFSEPLNPLTVTATTFILKNSANVAVTGNITTNGVTVTFAVPPGSPLSFGTTYTATLTTGIKDLAGNALQTNFSWTFTTGAAPDTTRPTVSATTPANGAANTSPSSALMAVFSEPVDPLTVTASTFTLRNSANVTVTGNITTNGATVTFALPPGSPLSFGTTYTATLTTGIKDLAGNALQTNFSWTFTTGAAPDTTRPTVSATTPINGATNIPLSTGLTATFTEPVNPSTVTGATFTLRDNANTTLASTVTVNGPTVTLAVGPGTPLQYGTTYTATLTTGITDLSGNALQTNFSWSFTTSLAPDTTPPVVSTTSPANAAIGIATSSLITATLNEPVNPSSVSTTTFTLRDSNNSLVNATVSANGATITLIPSPGTSLANNRTYTATLTTGIQDLAGNALINPYSWSFTTTSAAAQTTGLDWPGDGSVRRMLYWHNPFPIYDATYIFKVYPRKKTTGTARYYTTFFWGNDGNFTWDHSNANTFYGAHPYPVPASAGPGQWEISVYGYDFVTGTEVDWNRWHTQAFRAWRESSSITHHEFYYDWPDTSKKISYTVNDPAWAHTNPPIPAIVMGQAPNLNGVSWGGYPGWEEFNGVIRGIQMYSGLLSLADIQAEINTPKSTAAGQNLIWYLNPNPTPTDVTDKSGKGHHPSWDGSGRPTLYVGP